MGECTFCVVGMTGLSLAIVIITVTMMLMLYYQRVAHDAKLKGMKEEAAQVDIQAALDTTRKLPFPFHLVKAKDFREMGELIEHEELREQGMLKSLDMLTEVRDFAIKHDMIFFSHQWTSFNGNPDHTKRQYRAMCQALEHLIKENGWDEEEVYCFADYSSIPQRCKEMQSLAINAIPTFVSSVQAFVAVVPEVLHAHTQALCNGDSYLMRLWCRTEVVCHMLANGTSRMFIADEKGTRPMERAHLMEHNVLHMFKNSRSTCCRLKHKNMALCDRRRLIAPVLGMYAFIHANSDRSDLEDIIQDINRDAEDIFPRTFEYCCVDEDDVETTRTVSLFENLKFKMEEYIDTHDNTRYALSRSLKLTKQETKRTQARPISATTKEGRDLWASVMGSAVIASDQQHKLKDGKKKSGEGKKAFNLFGSGGGGDPGWRRRRARRGRGSPAAPVGLLG